MIGILDASVTKSISDLSICGYGEIGKHKGLKIPQLLLYEFKSHYPHQLGPIAQWLEQTTHNRLVAGSSPVWATSYLKSHTSFCST